ncbi:MAG: hypothetical protein JWM09_112 [Francisellaceae bacterium]|nr:hypothetical protein [Francisellaceae bacterium]
MINNQVKALNSKKEERKYLENIFVNADIEIEGSDAAKEIFLNYPITLLPITPFEYKWVYSDNQYILKKHQDALDHTIKIVLYGPKEKKVNFLCLIDEINYQSFAHTRARSFNAEARKYPMFPRKDYVIPEFNYEALGRTKYHMPGHCIDHADTLEIGDKTSYSTFDKRNFIPEPPNSYWGRYIRNPLTKEIRSNQGAYLQFPYYGNNPLKTQDGTLVPEGVFFSELKDNQVLKTYNISWDFNRRNSPNKKGKGFLQELNSHVLSTPIATIDNPSQSDREIDSLIRQLNTIRQSYETGALKAHNHPQIVKNYDIRLAEYEYLSPQFKIDAALKASRREENYQSAKIFDRALHQAEFIQNLDEKRILITEEQFEQCKQNLKNQTAGFEDNDERIIDRLEKINKDGLDYVKYLFK